MINCSVLVQVCRALIEAGANINALDKKRIHAYHRAAKNGHVAVLRVLAAHRAKIDVADVLSELSFLNKISRKKYFNSRR